MKQMRTAFFWLITQRAVVIHYQRFGTTLEDGTDTLFQRILLAYYEASSGNSFLTFWDNP